MSFTVYSDGSGTNKGPAGLGYYAEQDGQFHSEGNLPVTEGTNQKAEILAAAYALHSIPEGQDVTLISDSEYVVKGWNEYLPRWQHNGWQRSTGGDVKNQNHWKRLLEAAARHTTVRFEWTRGHDGCAGNERADQLAGEARAQAKAAIAAKQELTDEQAILHDIVHLLDGTPVADHDEWELDAHKAGGVYAFGGATRYDDRRNTSAVRTVSSFAEFQRQQAAEAASDETPVVDPDHEQAALFEVAQPTSRQTRL